MEAFLELQERQDIMNAKFSSIEGMLQTLISSRATEGQVAAKPRKPKRKAESKSKPRTESESGESGTDSEEDSEEVSTKKLRLDSEKAAEKLEKFVDSWPKTHVGLESLQSVKEKGAILLRQLNNVKNRDFKTLLRLVRSVIFGPAAASLGVANFEGSPDPLDTYDEGKCKELYLGFTSRLEMELNPTSNVAFQDITKFRTDWTSVASLREGYERLRAWLDPMFKKFWEVKNPRIRTEGVA